MREILVRVSRHATDPHDHSSMLDASIRIVQLRADRTHILPLGKHQHFLNPIWCCDLNIVVQKQEIITAGVLRAKVVDG